MFTEAIKGAHASHNVTTRTRDVLLFLITLVFTLTISPIKAHAQVIGDLDVTIPFQFHAGDAKFPAGKYLIHTVENYDLTLMEISSADGSTSALFEVRDAEANSAPAKSELIFNKYGDRYFLTKIFDEGNPNGSTVVESRYEKRVGQAATEAQSHVLAHRKGQQGG
jgi:hypothetical protein